MALCGGESRRLRPQTGWWRMHDVEGPFGSVDAAHEYVGLLREAVAETRIGLADDSAQADREGATRRLEALRLVAHKLERLERHLEASRSLLNDLRTLRRLLLCGWGAPPDEPPGPERG
jgi:hypothetical protein